MTEMPVSTSATDAKNWPPVKTNGFMGDQGGLPMRILIVDGDDAMKDSIASYFGEHNMRVARASGREDLSSQFASDEPDLVILEVHLAKEDGLDLLREIRAWSDVPVILTSQ